MCLEKLLCVMNWVGYKFSWLFFSYVCGGFFLLLLSYELWLVYVVLLEWIWIWLNFVDVGMG